MSEFAGHLKTYDDKRDEEIVDEGVLIEVTTFNKDGTVELAFNDRNERCYLRLRLQDLMEHVSQFGGVAE